MSVVTYTMVVANVLAVILNAAVLVTFIRRRRQLITPFGIHIFNTTLISLLAALTINPLVLYRSVKGNAFRGNSAMCGVYNYCLYSIFAASFDQNCIICLDRWLALVRPTWYRTKTIRFGITCALVALLYNQLIFLPLFIAEVVSYQSRDSSFVCNIVSWPIYRVVREFLMTYAPQVIARMMSEMSLWWSFTMLERFTDGQSTRVMDAYYLHWY